MYYWNLNSLQTSGFMPDEPSVDGLYESTFKLFKTYPMSEISRSTDNVCNRPIFTIWRPSYRRLDSCQMQCLQTVCMSVIFNYSRRMQEVTWVGLQTMSVTDTFLLYEDCLHSPIFLSVQTVCVVSKISFCRQSRYRKFSTATYWICM